MKTLKKIIACVMAVATLGTMSSITASANDVQMVNYLGGSYYRSQSYYENWCYEGKTAIIQENVDDKKYDFTTYYIDDTTNGIIQKDDIDLTTVDNIVFLGSTDDDAPEETLKSNMGIDLSEYDNVTNEMRYFYNATTNEYTYYYYNGDWLVTSLYLPNEIPTNVDDIQSYLINTSNAYVNYYLDYNDILDKPIFTALFDNENDTSSVNDFMYYDGGNLASFYSGINCTLFFESENDSLTIDDVLTEEQQDFLYFLEDTDSEDYCINIKLVNNGINEDTGLTRYNLYLPKCKGDLSYNEFMEYKYKLGQSLLDNGIAENSYFNGTVGFDDYNDIYAIANVALIMKDGSEPTTELFGEYADDVVSIEKVSCEEGVTLDGQDYYYKVTFNQSDDTLLNFSSDINIIKLISDLQSNEDVQFAGAVDISSVSTELYQHGKNMSYQIPILPSEDTSNETLTGAYYRADINDDGKVNVLDLLELKKYILKIVTW